MSRIVKAEHEKRVRELQIENWGLSELRDNTESPSEKERLQELIDENLHQRDVIEEESSWENHTYDLVETMLCGTGVTCRGREKELVQIARNIVHELRYGEHE